VVPRLKWPNDVLLNGRKLAGLLLEGGEARGGGGVWIVIGIGVNLTRAPEGLAQGAASLAAAGCADVTPHRFLEALAAPLARRLETWRVHGFGTLRQAWLDAAAGLGSEVKLRVGDCEFSGRFADLNADGSILLENPLGCLQEFSAGELFFGPPAPHREASPA
jgi:BirA family biotin operon repressor/biotin-[acetyl-CoA-carboxylase] ligase